MPIQLCCRPFWDFRTDWLDFACCASITTHCIAALYFDNEYFFSKYPQGATALDIVLCVLNIGIWAATLLLFCVVFVEDKFRWYSARTVSRNIAASVVDLQTQLRPFADQFMERLTPHVTKTDAIPALAFHQAARETLESNGRSYVSAVIDATLLIMKHADLPVNFLNEHVDDGKLDGIAQADVTKTAVRYCILFRISQFATSQALAAGS